MDTFESHSGGLESPARSAMEITPDDAARLGNVTRAVYVGAPGDLAVEMADGSTVVFASLPAGIVLPIRVARVAATGTTAGDLIGLW